MGNTSFSVSSGDLVTVRVSWILSLTPSLSQNTESAMYKWPVPVKHDVLEGISQRTGPEGPVSHSIVCHGRSTSSRYFIKRVKYRYQSSDWQSLPTPTRSCTFAGDDTSPCDWGANESKLVSALQGAICGWRNPGWDWWVSLCASSRATVLDYKLLYQVKWAPQRSLAPLRGCPQQQALGLKLRYRRADIFWVLQHSRSE